MRIIAGQKRGMNLFSPPTKISRPITDKAKESLFNILQTYRLPDGALVADLFCGAGSLGLEALSRNAVHTTFVENQNKIIKTLHRNIQKARFTERSTVIKANAFTVGAPLLQNHQLYQLVFVDPPYRKSEDTTPQSPLAGLLHQLAIQTAQNAIVVVRTQKHCHLLQNYQSLKVIDRRQWASMIVTILRQSAT